MDWLIWVGAATSVSGLCGLIWCISIVVRAKRMKFPDDKMREVVRGVILPNMGALLLSALGLMMVVAGMLLG